VREEHVHCRKDDLSFLLLLSSLSPCMTVLLERRGLIRRSWGTQRVHVMQGLEIKKKDNFCHHSHHMHVTWCSLSSHFVHHSSLQSIILSSASSHLLQHDRNIDQS
jgi:hypothetical protein